MRRRQAACGKSTRRAKCVGGGAGRKRAHAHARWTPRETRLPTRQISGRAQPPSMSHGISPAGPGGGLVVRPSRSRRGVRRVSRRSPAFVFRSAWCPARRRFVSGHVCPGRAARRECVVRCGPPPRNVHIGPRRWWTALDHMRNFTIRAGLSGWCVAHALVAACRLAGARAVCRAACRSGCWLQ